MRHSPVFMWRLLMCLLITLCLAVMVAHGTARGLERIPIKDRTGQSGQARPVSIRQLLFGLDLLGSGDGEQPEQL